MRDKAAASWSGMAWDGVVWVETLEGGSARQAGAKQPNARLALAERRIHYGVAQSAPVLQFPLPQKYLLLGWFPESLHK